MTETLVVSCPEVKVRSGQINTDKSLKKFKLGDGKRSPGNVN